LLITALAAENLNSLERYALSAFPLALALAGLTRDDRVERVALAVLAGGVVALSSMAWLGVYVP
jgi:apolipoprotein N-acyltransferase